MDSILKKLDKVDIMMDLYDDIAPIQLSPEQQIKLCSTIPCSVNLTLGNVLYVIEKKYKQKLMRYRGKDRLKWLKINLEILAPNLEERYLKWERKYLINKKENWLKRKLTILEGFTIQDLYGKPKPRCLTQIEEVHPGRLSHLSHTTNGTCSTFDDSVLTVIPSQNKNIEESSEELAYSPLKILRNHLLNISSHEESELPQQCSSNENLSSLLKSIQSSPKNRRTTSYLVQEIDNNILSEGTYRSFSQDMHVTSTQDFC